MSADITDVTLIKDEDLLKRLWQDTEDFGRKKEIRAHMYKLREARLREFYNTDEVSTEIQKTTTKDTKSCNMPKHADSMADHSFLGLKSKEIRDSESPTRDISYRISDKHSDNGWTIVSATERSDDGKTHTRTKEATKSGTQKFDGGKIDYAAKNQEELSVYKDGDDKNFTKSVGASSNTMIKQEAVGGDEHSNFRSTSTKTSSSSQVVTEHRSTSGDVTENLKALPTISHETAKNVSTETFTTNVPRDVKNHPNYIEGKTKVTRETKTLADGTIVTTTKYETKSGNSTQISTSTQYETPAKTNEQRSSTTRSSSQQSYSQSNRKTVQDSVKDQTNIRNTKAIEYHTDYRDVPEIDINITRHHYDQNQDVTSINKSQQMRNENVERKINVQVDNRISNVYKQTNEASDFKTHRETRYEPRENQTTYTTTKTKNIINEEVPCKRYEVTNTTNISQDNRKIINDEFINSERKQENDSRDTKFTTVTKTIDTSPERKPKEGKTERRPKESESQPITEAPEKRTKEPQRYYETSDQRHPIKPCKSELDQKPQPTAKEPQKSYEIPEKRHPIKPGKSELDQKPQPTEGQYETTYRTDYTNKRISVDISPTHDAFARSLRAVSPDRISKCSSPSRSSLRTSQNSLRNSTSPEKLRQPSRYSPERPSKSRDSSPRKSVDRFSSSETITYKSNRTSPDKRSPVKSPERTFKVDIIRNRQTDNRSTLTTKTNTYNTDTITRRRKITNEDTDITRNTRNYSMRSRSPSPTSVASDIEYIRNTSDIVTDLDIEDTNKTTVTKNARTDIYNTESVIKDTRPTSLEIKTTRKSKKITERSPTSPLSDLISPKKSPNKDQIPKEVPRKSSLKSPTKETSPSEKPPKYFNADTPRTVPADRPFKRTDTYEERCRQILGITSDVTEKRKTSLERTSSVKRNSITKENTKSITKDYSRRTSKSPEKSPTKVNDYTSQIRKSPQKENVPRTPERKSPSKERPLVQEFPAQIRKAPLKEPLGPYPQRTSPNKDKPSVHEFPSQVRKSPTKEPLEPYPERKSSVKDKTLVQEFPSQIRKSPTKEPLEPYTEKKSPVKDKSSVQEFPSQVRKSPNKEQLENYPERKFPVKNKPTIEEFPSQIRKITDNEPLEPYPERKSPSKEKPSITEFPSQTRKSPTKEPLELYPQRKSPVKDKPSPAQEFPSQICTSPNKGPLAEYPLVQSPSKNKPSSDQEFPETTDVYPERISAIKDTLSYVQESPSQIREESKKEPQKVYHEKKSPIKEKPYVQEFPSQIRRLPSKEPLEPYPETRSPVKDKQSVQEFPSQTRKEPTKEHLEPYLEIKTPVKDKSTVEEFPPQIRKSPPKEPLEPYSEKRTPLKEKQLVHEFPSQFRQSPQKESPLREIPSMPITRNELLNGYPKETKSPKEGKPKTSTETSEDESEIEEEMTTVTKLTQLEGKVPVNEPLLTKKFITALCREEEIERREATKSTTESLLEQQIISNEDEIMEDYKRPSKKAVNQVFIENEINESIANDATKSKPIQPTTKKVNGPTKERKTTTTTITKSPKDTPREKQTTKPPLTKGPKETVIEKKNKLETETEYTGEFCRKTIQTKTKPHNKVLQKSQERITLYDVGDTVDNTVHIRTHRIDEATTKKVVGKSPVKPKDSPVKTKQSIERKTTDNVVPKRTQPTQKSLTRPQTTQKTPTKLSDLKPKSTVQTLNKTTEKITKQPTSETKDNTSTTKKRVVQNIILKPKTKPNDTVPSRHTVSTTITVIPKVRPTTAKPSTKTITTKTTSTTTTRLTRPSQKSPKHPKLQNGHVSTDSEDESVADSLEGSFVDEICETNTAKDKLTKITRTTSDQIIKTPHRAPVRGLSKPELISPTKEPDSTSPRNIKKLEKKCISTKSIIINNNTEREIIVDLQRSKSSREPTPDRVCPLPISSEDDAGTPRYPDQVTEPDDGSLRRKPKRLSDIPIMEGNTSDYNRITEVSDSKVTSSDEIEDTLLNVKKELMEKVDRVDETDESLLTVDKKIHKFLDTAEKLNKKPLRSTSPAPKVSRPYFTVDDSLESDECLLSVSDKVNKFITTAEQLTTPQSVPERPKSPKCQYYRDTVEDDSSINVTEKVTHFTTTAEDVVKPKRPSQGPAPKVPRPDLTNVDDSIKQDDCLLSVSDKVTKFITTAEKLTSSEINKPVSLAKIDIKPKTDSRRKSPTKSIPTECPTIEKEEDLLIRRTSLSPERRTSPRRSLTPKQELDDRTPARKPSNQYTTINKTVTDETRYPKRDSSPKLSDTTPKSTRRPSQDETKVVLSSTGRLRSTESIKRAKALFEGVTNIETKETKERDILNRPSVFDSRKLKPSDTTRPTEANLTRTRLTYSDNEEEMTQRSTSKVTSRTVTTKEKEDALRSTKMVMENARQRSKSPEKVPEIITTRPFSKESTPDYGDLPGYMRPLDRSLRPNSPHRDSVNQINKTNPATQPSDADEGRPTKFGVTLRRTDSGRIITSQSTTTERKKSNIVTEKRVTEEEIEEIFDLEVLEELLDKVVGYDIRRNIRTQIRLVKKLLSENKLEAYILKRTTATTRDTPRREESPSKIKPFKPNDILPKTADVKKVTEHTSEFTRKSSPERKIVDNKLFSHTDLVTKQERTTEYQSSYSTSERRTSSDYSTVIRRSKSPETKPTRQKSPEKSPTRISPEKKTGIKSQTKETFTTLRKTVPVKKTVADDQPEWTRQRNLRKTSDTTSSVKKVSSTTSSKTTVKSSSPLKEIRPTDLITSSYGVGPTDENGTPLFGLKALRAQNKTDTTKVQGTVITSEYYSENGHEPVGQITVTKYSNDPSDLGSDEEIVNNRGLTSVTTTQKFGYKDTPTLRSLREKKKEISDTDESITTTTKTSSKVTRRGSVKALSQKFIDNAVETLKSEKQTSYPKAGLILRTSSFKDSTTGKSKEESLSDEETETVTVKTVSGETFLTNRTRVFGVQDVISRMKADESEVGDTDEDIQARGLLNKFIGSQVLLSGMESQTSSKSISTSSTSSPTSTIKRTTKVTTTVTEGGKPTTSTRVFQRPVTHEELETVWDEQTLRFLLEQSTDYEERKTIRARLRQVMAEQEACTELVEKASQDQGSGTIDGESLLLPLLQGLLEAPDNEQTADSGTESGEDQRSGLIAEVQNALDKLAASLRSDSTDITPERRSSLLQLVTKLQAGLATSPPHMERRCSGQGRFNRRRQRQNRHTVGVSSEELADARRLMEEISLHDLNPSQSEPKVLEPKQTNTKLLLQKQHSESSVGKQSSSSSFSNYINKTPVKNATAKPYGSSNSNSQSISAASSSVQTPTEPSEYMDLVFNEESNEPLFHESPPVQIREKKANYTYRQSVSLDHDHPKSKARYSLPEGDSIDINVNIKSIQQAVQQAAAIKMLSELKTEAGNTQDSETDEDPSTVKASQSQKQEINETSTSQPQNNIILKDNPIYSIPVESTIKPQSYEERSNRFNNKKLRMKRANTIDIPKPLNFYEDDYDSDSSAAEDDIIQRRRNTYYALRGPIRVGNTSDKNNVPVLEPKTDSDRKFLAFLDKHNGKNKNASMWSNQANQSVWGNKFGNIKSAFEKDTTLQSKSKNSARNFWKSSDDSVTAGVVSHAGPKISKQSAKNLKQMFEEKQRQSQQQSITDKNIVTGSLRVNTKSFEPEKNYKIVPQPLPMNKFSHAPQSAFKPITKQVVPKPGSLKLQSKEIIKNEVKGDERNPDSPLYLYSPKPLFPGQSNDSNSSSPITSKPWAASTGEHRVLSLAASKFENQNPPEQHPIKPRKLSKDFNKIFSPTATAQKMPEKLTAPYLVKSVDHNKSSVRKLSGQYDSIGTKVSDYTAQTNVKYVSPQITNSKSTLLHHYQQYPQTYQTNYNYTQQYAKTPKQATSQSYQCYQQPSQSKYPVHSEQLQKYSQQVTLESPSHKHNYYEPKYDAEQNHIYSDTGKTIPPKPQLSPQFLQSYEPKNYSIQYDKPHYVEPAKPSKQIANQAIIQPQNYSIQYDRPHYVEPKLELKTQPIVLPPLQSENNFKHMTQPVISPLHHSENEFVSTYTFEPQNTAPSRELYGPVYNNVQRTLPQSQHQPIPTMPADLPPKLENQMSVEGVKEYTAVSSKVMTGPQSQQAVTVHQKSPMSRDGHDMEAALNLKNTLQNISKSPSPQSKSPVSYSFKYATEERKAVSPTSNSFNYGANRKSPLSTQSFKHNIRENSSSNRLKQFDEPPKIRSPVSPKFNPSQATHHYPNKKPVSLESLEINDEGQSVVTSKFHIPVINIPSPEPSQRPTHSQILSKSDSWYNICQQPQHKPSPRSSPNTRTILKSKSSHSLVVPKQYEAGMSKEEIAQKKKTMEAYITGGNKSPQPIAKTPSSDNLATSEAKVVKRSINRTRTSEKTSAFRQSSEKVVTTKNTISDSPVTTTQVTTRVTSQQMSKKPISPFAKFRQLDKQNSLNTPPSTPKTPSGSGPLFKFTDPALSQSASTIKDRLLFWCKMKTKEYENIQLDNFSTSWADGLAFCALIHHFLPDAFDYHALTPKERRHNFTLAFRVADEKADIAPLLDVDDMVATRKPDWKCVFTYVQSIYRRFKDED